jgi:hypothetical protein
MRSRASTIVSLLVLGFVLVCGAAGAEEDEETPVGNTLWTAPKTEGFAVVGYLPEWRFGGTDW